MSWHSMRALNVTENSATIELSSDGSWASVTVYIRNGGFSGNLLASESGANQYSNGGINYLNIYLTGLSAGNSYAIYASYQSASGPTDLTDCSPVYFTTDEPVPFSGSLSSPYDGYSETGASLYISGNAVDSSGISSINIYVDGVYKASTSADGYGNFSYSMDLANIAFTSHTLTVYAVTGSNGTYTVGLVTFYRVKPRPSDWDWNTYIASGANVYNTVQNENIVTAYVMPYTEWNNFISRINEFRTYKSFSTIAFYSISSGSSCTSAVMNQAASAINAMVNAMYYVESVSDKEDVPAWVFQNMKTALNSL